jgi:hypothetical protein
MINKKIKDRKNVVIQNADKVEMLVVPKTEDSFLVTEEKRK